MHQIDEATDTCTDHVYTYVVNQLLEHRLLPGEVVSRRELARTLGVSVTPVGEAILQLEVEGILETKPRSGTRVRRFSEGDARATLTVRIALESEAVHMICGGRVEEHAPRILPLARRVDQKGVSGATLLAADIAFHRALVELTDCAPLLWHFDRVARQSLLLTALLQHPVSQRMSHVRLLEELCTASPVHGQSLIRLHLCHGKVYAATDTASAPPVLSIHQGTASGRLNRSMTRLLEKRGV
jgi:DNA-binding GntR family transcriptional regulator